MIGEPASWTLPGKAGSLGLSANWDTFTLTHSHSHTDWHWTGDNCRRVQMSARGGRSGRTLERSLPHHLTTSPYTVHISREKYDHQPARLLFSLPKDAHHRWWYMARRRKWRRKKTKEKDKVVSVARQSVSCQCQIDRRLSSAQSE